VGGWGPKTRHTREGGWVGATQHANGGGEVGGGGRRRGTASGGYCCRCSAVVAGCSCASAMWLATTSAKYIFVSIWLATARVATKIDELGRMQKYPPLPASHSRRPALFIGFVTAVCCCVSPAGPQFPPAVLPPQQQLPLAACAALLQWLMRPQAAAAEHHPA